MNKNNFTEKIITGGAAAAEAMRQINPDVVSAYPITPQTPIIETYAQFVADGKVNTEYIQVESEHSALSSVVGAVAAGARAMTATSSQGLAYMWEVLGVASGMRLPIVMSIANRTLSAPLNIHGDHSDSMGAEDQGWIQLFCETNQEVYENTLLAQKLAEKAHLPVMVMHDGFVTSHNAERVNILKDNLAKKFIGEYNADKPLLNFNEPVSYGMVHLPETQMEVKKQQVDAMQDAIKIYLEVGKELSAITGNKYPLFEEYKLKDAEAVIVVSSSTAGTVKDVVDKLRKDGKKVGLLKIKLFRPFTYGQIAKVLGGKKSVAVMDRSADMGKAAPFYADVKIALAEAGLSNKTQSYIFGLGGRDIELGEIEQVFTELLSDKVSNKTKYIGLK